MMDVAIMGFGTIGSGVYEALEANRQLIAGRVGQKIAAKYILGLRDFPGAPVEDKIVHDFSGIVEDDDISIVVETMGGLNPAYPFVKACLEAGKHMATSNKALVAAHGTELLAIAREKQVSFMFEVSVGGGILIIRPLYRCLMGEQISKITGILNGATNFILTKTDKEGASSNGALKETQDLDYAERNPEADVKGHDTCRKIAILTAMATGREVNYEDIYTEGITKITGTGSKYAEKTGASVKLFGSSRMDGDTVHAWVALLMIGKNRPLYLVNDVCNGIMVKGNMVGTTMFYGSGADKLPTANAVVADIMEAATHPDSNVPLGWGSERLSIALMESSSHRYFVRISRRYEASKDMVANHLGNIEVIILEGLNEYAVVTGRMDEVKFHQAAEGLAADLNQSHQEVLQTIRAEL